MPRQGAIGALLDIYESAIADLKRSIENIPNEVLLLDINPQSPDEDCRSIQKILSHVVHSGYGYATSIHNLKGHNVQRPIKTFHVTIKNYLQDLTDVFIFTEKVFSEIENSELEQFDNNLKITTSWGQQYDIEQLTEHAIVHILRHKRQIENFNLKKL